MTPTPLGTGGLSELIEPTPSGAEQIHEAWIQEKRREIRVAAILAAILAILTTYFAALNTYVLYLSSPEPFSLELRSPALTNATPAYAVSVSWDAWDQGIGEPRRPSLSLDRVTIPQGDGPEPVLESNSPRAGFLQISVPNDVTPGRHSGQLVLRRTTQDDDLPEVASVPVVIGVSGGFWASWFVLRDWLIGLLLILVLLYFVCLGVFPAPSGMIHVLVNQGGHQRVRRVRLHVRKLAWILPWRRSVVPLSWICSRAALRSKLTGELLFIAPSLPVLFFGGKTGRGKLTRHRGDAIPLEAVLQEPFEACGAISPMYESSTYRVSDIERDADVLFRFVRRASSA